MGMATKETIAVCNGSCMSACTPNLTCANGQFAPSLDGSPTDIRALKNITLAGGTNLSTCLFNNSGPCSGFFGTELYSSEDAWAGSGGGFFAGTSVPDFQANVPTLVNASARNSPDVSMPATGLLAVSTGCAMGALVNNVCPAASLLPGQQTSFGRSGETRV